jgi:hypothetical protein
MPVDKIFNVRKVQYKQFDHEKCTVSLKVDLKPTFSPFQAKEHLKEPISSTKSIIFRQSRHQKGRRIQLPSRHHFFISLQRLNQEICGYQRVTKSGKAEEA